MQKVMRSKIVNAEADAQVFTVVGKAKAENTLAVGTAEAEVIQRKTGGGWSK